jgi:hypothetical protein
MRFRFRQNLRLGPFVWRFSQSGYTGWGIQIGRYRWNARTGRHSFDSPGIGGWQWGGKRRRR